MELEFSGEIRYWRGPSPFHSVTVPPEQSDEIAAVARQVGHGWGVIPVAATVGGTGWTTSLFPRDGGHALPVKKAVRDTEQLDVGDVVEVRVTV